GGARLVQEAPQQVLVPHVVPVQHLDRDAASDGGMLGEVDCPHPPLAQQRDRPVVAKLLANHGAPRWYLTAGLNSDFFRRGWRVEAGSRPAPPGPGRAAGPRGESPIVRRNARRRGSSRPPTCKASAGFAPPAGRPPRPARRPAPARPPRAGRPEAR